MDINSSLHLLEKLAVSVKYNEAVLMVGETGTGKTTMVQDLAMRLGQRLTVLVIFLFGILMFLLFSLFLVSDRHISFCTRT